MFSASVNVQAGDPYYELVWFPCQISPLISILISGIATITVVFLSVIFKLYKRPLSLMVLAISIAHVLFYFSKLSVLVFQPQSDLHCRILSILCVFGINSAVIWGALFAHAFYITLKYQNINEVSRMMKYYLIGAVLLPIFSGILSFLTNHLFYSPTEGTCVHRIYPNRFDVSDNICVLFPVWVACIASIIWYKMAINKISELQWTQTGSELYLLMIYPGILVFCWAPTLVTQTAMQFGATPSQTLNNILIFITNMQGLFDALVYGRSVREELRDSFKKLFGKQTPQEEQLFIEPHILEEKSDRSSGAYLTMSIRSEGSRNLNR